MMVTSHTRHKVFMNVKVSPRTVNADFIHNDVDNLFTFLNTTLFNI